MCHRIYSQGWCNTGEHYIGVARPYILYPCTIAAVHQPEGHMQCRVITDDIRIKRPIVETCDECLAKQMEQMYVDARAKFEAGKGGDDKGDGRRRSFP